MVASTVRLPPPWLHSLVAKTDFYDKTCKTHVSQYETRFCKTCLGSQCLCQCCLERSVHKHHNTGQVLIVSHRVSINVDDLNKIWDVKEIQPYKINYKIVVLLHERSDKKEHGCRMCSGQMLDSTNYKYCSIQCQLKSMSGGNIEELFQTTEAGPSHTSDDGLLLFSKGSWTPVVKKGRSNNRPNRRVQKCRPKAAKRNSIGQALVVRVKVQEDRVVVPMIKSHNNRRKGIPHRSPLF